MRSILNYKKIQKGEIREITPSSVFATFIVSIPIICYSTVLLFIFFNCTMGLWTNSWAVTKGVLVVNYDQVEEVNIPSDSKAGTSRTSINKNHRFIEYLYEVNNIKYVSNRVSYFDSFLNDKKYLSEGSKKINLQIDVYYNKYYPQFSVLKRGLNLEFEDYIIIGILVFIGIAFIEISTYSGNKSNFG